MTEPKTAPVQAESRCRIPWDVHVRAWQVYAAIGHGSQSAQRIAERGGFGTYEIALLLAERNPFAPIGVDGLHDHQRARLADLRKRNAEEDGPCR